MNHEECIEKRQKALTRQQAMMPVWLVKWKGDGKGRYLASDHLNEWVSSRDGAYRFPTRTNADMVRRAIGATAFYTRLVRLTKVVK